MVPELSNAIGTAQNSDGKLECASAWAIAQELGIDEQQVANAAEALGVRIVSCQLGAF